MIKNMRMLVLVVIVVLSLISFILPFLLREVGVEVVSVSGDSKCGNIKSGDVITQINDIFIENVIDFNNVVKALNAGSYATMIINNGPGGCIASGDGNLGLNVKDVPSGGIKFGLELGGGITKTYVLANYSLAENSLTERTVDIVKKRIEIAGLNGVKAYLFEADDKKTYLKISSIADENLEVLTINGEFTAKIRQNVEMKDNDGRFVVGDKTHSVLYSDGISVDGIKVDLFEEFTLDNIKFYMTNFTNNSVTLDALVFSNEDVTSMLTAASYVSYRSEINQYEFFMRPYISDTAANIFANLTKRMNTKMAGDSILLDGELVYSLDGNVISTLPISFETAGKVMNTLPIMGFDTSAKSANLKKMEIETVLQSGSLLAPLEFVGSEKYTGIFEYGAKYYLPFLSSATIFIFVLAGRIKIGSWRNGFYSTALSLAEVVFILGLISLIQSFGYSWIIDIETIIGLFAIIFIGYIDSYLKMSNKQKVIFKLCIFVIAFVTLFTTLKGFGMTLTSVLVLKIILTDYVRNKFIENIRHGT